MQYSARLLAASEAQGPVQGVGHRLDTLLGERLIPDGQVSPAEQRASAEGDFNAVVAVAVARLSHKQTADLVGILHHLFAKPIRQLRSGLFQKLPFRFRLWISDFAEDEAIHQRQILAHGALVQTDFIAAAVGVGRGCEAERIVRYDKLAPVFRNAQGLAVQNAIQPSGCGWFEQIQLVAEQQAAEFYGQSQ